MQALLKPLQTLTCHGWRFGYGDVLLVSGVGCLLAQERGFNCWPVVTHQPPKEDGGQLATLAQVAGRAPRAAKASAQFYCVNKIGRQLWAVRGGFGRLVNRIVFHASTLAAA
jgi:hypothetical protein